MGAVRGYLLGARMFYVLAVVTEVVLLVFFSKKHITDLLNEPEILMYHFRAFRAFSLSINLSSSSFPRLIE